jgi:hypothetical protein
VSKPFNGDDLRAIEAHLLRQEVWGTRQPLSEPPITAFVQIGAQSKQVVHQELDRIEAARSSGWQYEDHANSRMAGQKFNARMEPS